MSCDFLSERLEAVKRQIVAAEQVIDAVQAGDGIEEYSLDTGQTKQRVKFKSLDELRRYYDGLLERYSQLNARVNGGGTIIMRPGF